MAYQKSWTLNAWSGRLDSKRLDSGRLDAWTLDAWSLDTWTLDAWTLGFWTQKVLSIFSDIYFFLKHFKCLMTNVSWLIFMNNCYNLNLLDVSWEATTLCKVQPFFRIKLTLK